MCRDDIHEFCNNYVNLECSEIFHPLRIVWVKCRLLLTIKQEIIHRFSTKIGDMMYN